MLNGKNLAQATVRLEMEDPPTRLLTNANQVTVHWKEVHRLPIEGVHST